MGFDRWCRRQWESLLSLHEMNMKTSAARHRDDFFPWGGKMREIFQMIWYECVFESVDLCVVAISNHPAFARFFLSVMSKKAKSTSNILYEAKSHITCFFQSQFGHRGGNFPILLVNCYSISSFTYSQNLGVVKTRLTVGKFYSNKLYLLMFFMKGTLWTLMIHWFSSVLALPKLNLQFTNIKLCPLWWWYATKGTPWTLLPGLTCLTRWVHSAGWKYSRIWNVWFLWYWNFEPDLCQPIPDIAIGYSMYSHIIHSIYIYNYL